MRNSFYILLIIAGLTTQLSASTIGYWRFEGASTETAGANTCQRPYTVKCQGESRPRPG